ncbi:MAG: MFS transporter [Pseudomonadota bacterium]
MKPSSGQLVALALVVLGAVLGLAGTDLVLPAVPSLPTALGGDAALAQGVLAAYVAGVGLGLIVFGALSGAVSAATLLSAGLAGMALMSVLASYATSLPMLIGVRFLQGMCAAVAPVFAPGLIRALFSEQAALRAMGVLGSIESLTPALAPIGGVALLQVGGWQLSFRVLAVTAIATALLLWSLRHQIPTVVTASERGSYRRLFGIREYWRQTLAHAACLGGLLTFVFGAPAVIVSTLGGSLTQFVVMQVSGITTFIIAANSASWLVARYGQMTMIWFGSLLSLLGAIGIALYALAGGDNPWMLTPLFLPMNFGLGLRGVPGFYAAIVASDGDDARGSALLVLAIMLTTAIGTAIAAPMIQYGLAPLACVSASLSALSPAVLLWLGQRAGAHS